MTDESAGPPLRRAPREGPVRGRPGRRYNAACAALRAAAQAGAPEPAALRGRALAWLRADLDARRAVAGDAAGALREWRRDPDLAPVRQGIGDLPAEEREGWSRLWTDLGAALADPATGD